MELEKGTNYADLFCECTYISVPSSFSLILSI